MRKIFFITTIMFATMANAQNIKFYEPIELAQKLFSKEKFKEVKKYSTGEFYGRPNGRDFRKDVIKKFRMSFENENYAVVNITLIDKNNEGFDAYLHFEKEDNIWKISAFLALAMTGIVYGAKLEMEKMTEDEINAIINSENENRIFKSREDFDFQLENANIILSFDDDIIAFFEKNKNDFENLKNKIIELKTQNKDVNIYEELKSEIRKLRLHSLSSYELSCKECLIFSFGGILDNTVGYFYLEDKNKLPIPNNDSIIMIREIGNGWYLYKTT